MLKHQFDVWCNSIVWFGGIQIALKYGNLNNAMNFITKSKFFLYHVKYSKRMIVSFRCCLCWLWNFILATRKYYAKESNSFIILLGSIIIPEIWKGVGHNNKTKWRVCSSCNFCPWIHSIWMHPHNHQNYCCHNFMSNIFRSIFNDCLHNTWRKSASTTLSEAKLHT